MNKSVFAFMISIFFLSSRAAPAQQREAKDDLEKAVTAYFDALAAADLPAMKKHSTGDILILENGVSWNMDTIVNRVSMMKGMVIKRTNHITFIRTEVHGDQGFVAYDNQAEIQMADRTVNRHWLESANLVRKDGAWKIWFLHSTKLER
jgi:ketosteroid isomerase-like protein